MRKKIRHAYSHFACALKAWHRPGSVDEPRFFDDVFDRESFEAAQHFGANDGGR